MASSSSQLLSGPHVSTPEVLWHGGGNENGKPDPVYSCDLHPLNVLATAGIDANVPPKGSVRLWKVATTQEGQEFLIDLNDHQSVVNCVRFSPNGKFLASASDRMIVVYSVADANLWTTLTDMKSVERIYLRPSLEEIYDLEWSIDSNYIIVGAINNKAEIIRVSTRDALILPGHTSYVQGVAWDPLNEMVVTQSADRSCKVHQIKFKPGAMVRLNQRGHVIIKMHEGHIKPDGVAAAAAAGGAGAGTMANPLTAADFDDLTSSNTKNTQGRNIYADSTVPSFFRRPAFSPDGALLITPTGINRPFFPQESLGTANASSSTKSFTTYTGSLTADQKQTFCTHIFVRSHLSSPAISLVGLEEPSVAVRCSPVLYQLRQQPATTTSAATSATACASASASASSSAAGDDVLPCLLKGKYRFVFAVVTISAIMVYDTQHAYPIARFGGLHLACINDAAWSSDGNLLSVCSSDGYVTFIRFEPGSLGEPIPTEDVPITVKRALPFIYSYQEQEQQKVTAADPSTSSSTSSATAATAAAAASTAENEGQGDESDVGGDTEAVPDGQVNKVSEGENKDHATATTNAATAASIVAHTESAGVVVASSSSAQTHAQAEPTASASASAVAVAGVPNSAEKKRKRITPTVVGSLGSVSAVGNVAVDTPRSTTGTDTGTGTPHSQGHGQAQSGTASVAAIMSTGSPSAAVVAVATRDQAAGEKKKKRITPILVSTQDMSFSTTSVTTTIAPTSAAISGSSGTTTAAAVAPSVAAAVAPVGVLPPQ